MKVSIQVLGSLGDVAPYIAAARALQARGVAVSILAPADYTAVIADAGILPEPTSAFSLADWLTEARRRNTLANPLHLWRDWGQMIAPYVDDVMRWSRRAAQGADIVVANLICAPARVAAEAEGCAFMLTAQQPVLSPTGALPCAMVWRPWMGEGLNRTSYSVVGLSHRLIGRHLARYRREFGLVKSPGFSDLRTHLGRPLVKVTSLPAPLLPPRPTDWTPADQLTAYPALDIGAGALPAALLQFLAVGAAPVYLGLGSLGEAGNSGLIDASLGALAALGRRGIFAASLVGARGISGAGHFVTPHVRHDLLFPHCAAVLHHGGAGTTDTCLRAGVPQIIQPHVLDQFWYSAALQRLNVAGPALPAGAVTTPAMTRAITDALSPARIAAARATAQQANGAGDLAALIIASAERFAARSS
jgi:UDP:flavonoid glycosyltransferase YjiC (YdhE family)